MQTKLKKLERAFYEKVALHQSILPSEKGTTPPQAKSTKIDLHMIDQRDSGIAKTQNAQLKNFKSQLITKTFDYQTKQFEAWQGRCFDETTTEAQLHFSE